MDSPLPKDTLTIVQQLRAVPKTWKMKTAKDEYYLIGQLSHEAADEIGRLQKALLDAQQLAIRQANQLRRARSDMESNDHLNARAIFGEPQS